MEVVAAGTAGASQAVEEPEGVMEGVGPPVASRVPVEAAAVMAEARAGGSQCTRPTRSSPPL
jgi:hypothetical protein